jgi:hypothetical protein
MNSEVETEPDLLEVLPDGPLRAALCRHYIVRLRHELGTLRVIAAAANHRSAIDRVLEAAGAPRSSVLTVQKIKAKRRDATAGTVFKSLKYVAAKG